MLPTRRSDHAEQLVMEQVIRVAVSLAADRETWQPADGFETAAAAESILHITQCSLRDMQKASRCVRSRPARKDSLASSAPLSALPTLGP